MNPGPVVQNSPFVQQVLDFFHNQLPRRANYEERPQQLEMAAKVARALEDEEILVAEAGTGTGKSLAYLIPALLWAHKHGGPIVVSTRTLNLQQQLLEHDIPLLQELFRHPFRAAPARGWSNYVCLRRLHALPGSGQVEPWAEQEAVRIAQELNQGAPGIRQQLAVGEGLWSHITCESTACARQACPYFQGCYLFQERRLLERADLIITNHSLVLADLSLRRQGAPGILPKPAGLVLDEAHHLEEVANDHLSRGISRTAVTRLQEQLYRPKARFEEGGILPGVRAWVSGSSVYPEMRQALLNMVDRELLARLPDFYGVAENFFDELARLLQAVPQSRQGERSQRVGITMALFESPAAQALKDVAARLFVQAEQLQSSLGSLARSLTQEVLAASFNQEGEGLVQEVQSLAGQMGGFKSDLEFCLFPDNPDWVYWALESANDCQLGATPLDVGEVLAKELFGPTRALVLTSATLTSRGSFEFFERRTGVEHLPNRTVRMAVESPFDYREQAYLGVATDLPDPNHPQFFARVSEPLSRLMVELGGRTFLLLTSYASLKRAAAQLGPELEMHGIELLCQGELPNAKLLERFRKGKRSVLLGTDSFWEGVDVPGDALQCVIMARLPFRVPSDPIVEAHCRRLEAEGLNPFRDYQLPQAILRFRQGFGRLVRTQRDRGMVIVLDSRLYHRDYGRDFLESVPACTRRAGSLERVVNDSLVWLGRSGR